MTYRFYKKFLAAFFLLFIPALLLNEFGDKISWLIQHRLFATIIFYSYPILSLFLLYFGVYARVVKVKTVQKIQSPIGFIILGLLFTVLSFGRPIVGFMLMHDTTIESLPTSRLQTIRRTALDVSKRMGERLAAVKLYYIQTGESIEYLDENNSRVTYWPTEKDKNERKKHIQMKQSIDNIVALNKSITYNLMIFAAGSFIAFLMLLRYKTRR